MIYAIWALLWLTIVFLLWDRFNVGKKHNKETEKHYNEINILNETLVEEMNRPLAIWIISKHTEENIAFLKSNKEVLKTLMIYFEYQIAVKTDFMRNISTEVSSEEKAGYLNALHETHLFLYKLVNEVKPKTEYSGKDIV